MKWNCKRFDYTTGTLSGDWDLSDVHWFVDKEFGDDTNAGTANAPFATLTKAHTVATAGQVIMISGYFSENLAISKAVRIVGVSGMNGRAVFVNAVSRITISANVQIVMDNVMLQSYSHSNNFLAVTTTSIFPVYFSNCILADCTFAHSGAFGSSRRNEHYSYFCAYINIQIFVVSTANAFGEIHIYGNNNILSNLTSNDSNGERIRIFASNNICNNNMVIQNTGLNNLTNTDARFFTDDTETTPKLLTVAAPIINYNFRRELPHWDKTAGAYKTINPLYRTGTFDVINQMYRHIGAGNEVHVFNGYDTAFIDEGSGGTGTWTNIEVGGSGELYRTSTGSDGIIETGIIQFSRKLVGFTISLRNSVEVTANIVTKAIQSLDHTLLSKRAGYAIQIKIGDTTGQVDSCNWLNFEYGWKPVSYSLDGTTKVGNADAAFDETSEVIAGAKYIKLKIIFKSL